MKCYVTEDKHVSHSLRGQYRQDYTVYGYIYTQTSCACSCRGRMASVQPHTGAVDRVIIIYPTIYGACHRATVSSVELLQLWASQRQSHSLSWSSDLCCHMRRLHLHDPKCFHKSQRIKRFQLSDVFSYQRTLAAARSLEHVFRTLEKHRKNHDDLHQRTTDNTLDLLFMCGG